MDSTPTVLDEAKLLFVAAQAVGVAALALDDLLATSARLRSYAAHPACDDGQRERACGALLVLAALVDAHPANRPTALAG